jgi:hypothetical protein
LRRLHFFEIFTIVNLVAIALVARTSLTISVPAMLIAFVAGLLPYALAGVFVRVVIAAIRRDHAYFSIVRQWSWIRELLRLVVFTGVMIFTYGWIKLAVPLLHPTLFDPQLWNLDRILFFGLSPNIFFLDLFHAPSVLRVVDWTYANVFFVSITLALGYFFSHPSTRVRIAFANGNAALWLTGAWLYVLIPSLGPVFRFPDVWFPYQAMLPHTQALQILLWRNYQNVLRVIVEREPYETIRIVYGIAAFPSLHVAFQTYVFLWMRRLWKGGEVLFGVFVVIIFLGSIITGWHYLIDGLAGMLLAWACYAVTSRASRMKRWLDLSSRT